MRKEPEVFDPSKHTVQQLIDAFNELEKQRYKHRVMVEKSQDKKRATELNITYEEYVKLKEEQANIPKEDKPIEKRARGRPRKVVLPREVIEKHVYDREHKRRYELEQLERELTDSAEEEVM